MKTALKMFFVFLLGLLYVSAASAQQHPPPGATCYYVFNSTYGNYGSWSMSVDNTTIYTNSLTDGYETMSIYNYGCPQQALNQLQAGLTHGIHTPSSTNVIKSGANTVGGTVVGAQGCSSCYISESLTESSASLPGAPTSLEFDFGGNVICNIVGSIFGPPINKFQIEIATTWSIRNGFTSGTAPVYTTPLADWCTVLTSPPDFHPIFAVTPTYPTNSFFVGSALCSRYVGVTPWICSPGVVAIPPFTPANPEPCTHNP